LQGDFLVQKRIIILSLLKLQHESRFCPKMIALSLTQWRQEEMILSMNFEFGEESFKH
jgi:hypothetical protein